MKQIVIVMLNGVPHVSGITDSDQSIEPELTESLVQLIRELNNEMDKIKQPEQIQQELLRDYIKQTATDEQLIEFAFLFRKWFECLGEELETGELVVHEDILYRVIQPIVAMEHQPPEIVPAHYTRIVKPADPDEPVEYENWTPGSWDIGVRLWHNGRLWESQVPNNHWEPGAPGVYENIWKDFTDEV